MVEHIVHEAHDEVVGLEDDNVGEAAYAARDALGYRDRGQVRLLIHARSDALHEAVRIGERAIGVDEDDDVSARGPRAVVALLCAAADRCLVADDFCARRLGDRDGAIRTAAIGDNDLDIPVADRAELAEYRGKIFLFLKRGNDK